MATIITKFSSTSSAVPTASDLVQGELAVNTADKRLFTEDSGATIIEIGTNPSSITTGAITASGTVTSSSGFSGNLTGNVTGDVTGNITGDVTGDVTGSISGGTVAGSTGTFSSNVTASGTLGVTGATTLSDNLTMSDGRLQITNSSFNLKTFELTGSANTTSSAVYLSANNLTTGKALEVVSFSADSSSRSLVRLANTSGVATGTTVLQIDQSSSGNALSVSGDSLFTGDITVTGNATISGNLTFGDADTDSISLNADVDSHILPNTDDTYDLGSTSKQWRNLYINGTANIDSLVADTADINGGTVDNTAIGSTTASTGNFSTLSINGTAITATAAELNVLDGITATVTELNYTDGVTSNIQTQLDTKAPLASPTFTGTVTIPDATVTGDVSFGDNDKAIFGAGSDLQIYHDGSNSYVEDTATGSLILKGADVVVKDSSNNDIAKFVNGGAAQLRYAGATKLATTATGIDVTGTVVSDAIQVDTDSGITLKDGGDSRTLTFKIDAGTGRYQASGSADHFFTTTDSNLARFYIANTGDISFYEDTGTTPKFFWDASAERLGIGTSSPAAELHVVGSSGDSRITVEAPASQNTWLAFRNTGGADTYLIGYDPSASAFRFYDDVANTERMRIDSSGRVGIGSTSPAQLLHVENATGTAAANIISSTTADSQINLGDTASNAIGFIRYSNSTDSMQFTVNASERLRIDASGNVGIGNAAPQYQLDLNTTGSNTLFGSGISASTLGGPLNLNLSSWGQSGGRSGIITFTTGSTTNGSERMRIDTSGNVLVGKTVANDSTAGIRLGSTAGFMSLVRDSGRPLFIRRNTTDGDIVEFAKDGTTVGSISVTTSATTYNTSSDQRLKENITDADDAGSKVDAIQVRQFDWKADESHQDYGMIAQELVTVAPEAVHQPEDPEDMMGVDYSKLVPMLIKEIQSLRNRVATLEGN